VHRVSGARNFTSVRTDLAPLTRCTVLLALFRGFVAALEPPATIRDRSAVVRGLEVHHLRPLRAQSIRVLIVRRSETSAASLQ
jgi:hypothetical protein